jgi:hypothetical protein
MGECTYYLKAQFKTPAEAKKVLPKIQEFLREAQKAYDFWQKNRGEESVFADNAGFWTTMQEGFPTVYKYLEELGKTGKGRSNELSGIMDFGQHMEDIEGILQSGNEICYSACDVWHFSDWSYLAAFIKTHFKAVKVVIASEEDGCGSLDSLNLYEYEEIVTALVKHVNSLRDGGMLAARIKKIHPDLKALLEV